MSSFRNSVVVKILIGFFALVGGFFIWSSLLSTGVPQTNTKDDDKLISDSTTKQLSAGTYLVYQISTLVSKGTEEWANDDIEKTSIYRLRIGDDVPELVTEIIMDERWGGSIVSSVLGDKLLVHRYSSTGDAIVNLLGEAEEIPENWGLVRSQNGRYEVQYNSFYDEVGEGIEGLVLRNLVTGAEKQLRLPNTDPERIILRAIPNYVSKDGSTIYVLFQGGWEGPGPAKIWKLDVATDTLKEITSFSKLTHLDFSTQSFAHAMSTDRSKILVAQSGIGEGNAMGGMDPGPPTDVYLIDTTTDTSQMIFQDKDFLLSPITLSPDGTEWAHAIAYDESIWIMPAKSGHERKNSDLFAQGRLLEWLKNGIVVDRSGNDLVYIDRLTHEVTVLGRNIGSYFDPDYQTVEYIGSILFDQ